MDCEENAYAAKKGANICFACKLGEFAPPGSSQCSRCELGMFGNKAAADDAGTLVLARSETACLQCPRGFFGDGKGLLECRSCPGGRYGDKESAVSAADCSQCKQGRSSLEASANVSDCVCNVGLYRPTDSPLECLECPIGGDCSRLGATTATIQSLPGFWRKDTTTTTTFYECLNDIICPGGFPQEEKKEKEKEEKEKTEEKEENQIGRSNGTNVTSSSTAALDLSVNQCLIGNEDILCAVCVTGFDRIDGVCRICTLENVSNKLLVPVIVLVVGVILLLVICKSKTAKKYRILLKDVRRIVQINISFAQINSSLPSVVEGIVWPVEFRTLLARMNVVNLDLIELSGAGCAARLGYTQRFMGMASLPILTCMMGYLGLYVTKWRADRKVDAMSKEKKAEIEHTALEQAFKMVDRDGSGVIDVREMVLLLKEFGWKPPVDISSQQEEALLVERLELENAEATWKLDDFMHAIHSNLFHDEKIFHHNEGKIMNVQEITKWSFEEKAESIMLMMTALILLFVHTPVSKVCFEFFICQKIEYQYYMRSDYTIQCISGHEWLTLLPFVLTMLIGFTAGFPLSVVYYLYKHRYELYGAHVQGKYGWLYRPFRIGVEWWEVHEIIRRMLLTGVLIFFPPHIRAAVGVVICTFAILNLNYFKPHKDPALFWISQSSFVVVSCCCCVCAAASVLSL